VKLNLELRGQRANELVQSGCACMRQASRLNYPTLRLVWERQGSPGGGIKRQSSATSPWKPARSLPYHARSSPQHPCAPLATGGRQYPIPPTETSRNVIKMHYRTSCQQT